MDEDADTPVSTTTFSLGAIGGAPGSGGGGSAADALELANLAAMADDSGVKKKRVRVNVLSTTLDLEQHMANYKDVNTRIDRLLFIADRCVPLQIDAFTMALKELRTTVNVEKYQATVVKLNEVLTMQHMKPLQPDSQWKTATLTESRIKADQLEAELRTYKANLIKESIRMGYNDLGDHHYSTGDLPNALKNYVRIKDYGTTRSHILSMCFKVIKTSIGMGNFSQAQTFVAKAESIVDPPEKEKVATKLASISGLLNLEAGNFRKAAKCFLDVRFDQSDALFETISPNDVAIYGALTALASFERADLKTKVFENSNFKLFLELEPRVREVLHTFNALKFQTCMEILAKIKNDLLLDMYLHDHIEALYQQIRKKAILQYFFPYMSVDMNKMATSFNCSVADMERELAALIGEGQLQARIDSLNKILRAKESNPRTKLYAKALDLARDYNFQTRVALLRAKLYERDLVVQLPAGARR
ncbi:26S proteasome subunit RPN7-domain-containing protein [Entophlyctis helioformis]|nr:26S proteasome subunit RPN7-domain-containing protein [Entophlyctis helioformis]